MAHIGRYELVASLGRGGMAEVFLATAAGAHGLQRLVVVKRVRTDVDDDAHFQALLIDEARVAVRLHHPNVVQTIEVGEEAGLPGAPPSLYLAMEYLDGQPLHRLIAAARKSAKPIPAPIAARIVADALAGLHYAHELADYDGTPLHVVHRDISPPNLFVTYEGEAKVLDFGVAKAAFNASETVAGTLKGKVAYMAPEQALGHAVDRRADVFAMGLVLWELLTLQRMMRGELPSDSLRRLLHEPIPLLTDVVADADPVLAEICANALEKRLDRRTPTAAAMRDELEAYLFAQPKQVRRDEVGRFLSDRFAEERAARRREIQAFMTQAREPSESTDSSPGLPSLATSSDASLEAVGTGSPIYGARVSTIASAVTQGSAGARSLQAPKLADGNETVAASPMAATLAGGRVARSNAPPIVDAAGAEPRTSTASGDANRRSPAASIGLFLGLASVVGVGATALRSTPPPTVASAASSNAPSAAAPTSAPAAPLEIAPTLRLCGSNTVGESLAPALVEAFFKSRGAPTVARTQGDRGLTRVSVTTPGEPTKVVAIDAAGSSTAFTGLASRACDVGMSSRPIHADEAAKLVAAGLGDLTLSASEHVVALDGIAIVTHPNNRLRSIDVATLGAIFSGATTDWRDVAGSATTGPIAVYARDERSGTYDAFRAQILGSRPLVASAQRFADSEKLADAVALDPTAIGFIGLAYVRGAHAVPVGSRGAAPMLASAFTVTTESYYLSRRLYLYTPQLKTKTAASELALDLVRYALSPDGQAIVRAAGFVDLSIGMKDDLACASATAHCPPAYARAIDGKKRLSLDFRFRGDSDDLDARGEPDLDRLVDFLRAHAGARALLVGFGDARDGDATKAEKASLDRARRVADALTVRGVQGVEVRGFGAALPVAGDDDPLAHERNRRVEVWVQQ